MKFPDMPYRRVTVEEFTALADKYVAAINGAGSAKEAEDAIYACYEESSVLETNIALCGVRQRINTRDEFYKAEIEFYDENSPHMQMQAKRISDAMLECKFRPELEVALGSLLFRKLENEKRLNDEKIIPEMQEENKLTTKYSDLIGAAEIEFDGQTLNLAQLGPFRTSQDRDVRKRANAAYFGYFAQHQAELDEIFAQLTEIRDRKAKKLGFKNAVDYGYASMERFDYDEKMVEVYRNEVKKHIVPLAGELKERQRRRINIDKMYYYDDGYNFKTGNPKPQGTPDELVAAAKKMYRELSPESGEFFDYMVDNELMDLLAKPGKTSGGFCTEFSVYKAPFIFSNFNGTKDDVDVLTHEAGHALQVYLSMRELKLPPYYFPTYEACEIHSMSMELITRPWMNAFFGADTEKFLFQQLEDILYFLPYGCLVDEFQHHIYRNPDESPDERAAAWRKLEKEYMPYLDFDGDPYLENGRRWQRQQHIYTSPFYYIDYTLAQVCAIQFFVRFLNKDPDAFPDYLRLCKVGGTKTFVSLVEYAGLKSPFIEGVLAGAVASLRDVLDATDDSAF